MKKQEKTQETNLKIERAETKRYECITTYHLNDKRLNLAEKGLLTILYCLPPSWRITKRATSQYLGISDKTFFNYLHRFIELGYIEIKKTKNNKATYKLRERAITCDFNPRYIDAYTIKQLNNYLNDSRTEERYKNLIRKALDSATKTSEHFEKTLDDIDKETETETLKGNDLLPF